MLARELWKNPMNSKTYALGPDHNFFVLPTVPRNSQVSNVTTMLIPVENRAPCESMLEPETEKYGYGL